MNIEQNATLYVKQNNSVIFFPTLFYNLQTNVVIIFFTKTAFIAQSGTLLITCNGIYLHTNARKKAVFLFFTG